MKLGICTRYNSHEAAFAAIRLANAAERLGLDVEMLTMTEEPANLCPKWDRQVMRAEFVPFTRWVSYLDHIIWTTVPHFAQIDWVRQQKKRTSILTLWNEIERSDARSLSIANQLICPSNACVKMMIKAGFKNTRLMPWDCGHPLYKKPDGYTITSPKVLLPLWDGNARKLELTLLTLLDECLWKNTEVSFTVICNSSTISSRALRGFKELHKRHGRIEVLRGVQPHSRFKFFQSHDLTLCPFHYDNVGMTAIQSIEMGTPVVGFNISPCDEFMHAGNSAVVKCQTAFNDMNVPRVVPDYLALEKLLISLLDDKQKLRLMQQSTLANAEQRRTWFNQCAKTVLL